MRQIFVSFFAFLFAASIGSASFSQTVFSISAMDGESSKTLTLDDLLALDQHTVVTSNDFVDGDRTFSGPLARDLLMLCKAGDAVTVRLTAANDYQIEINAREFFTYDAILALKMDGELLSKREKGPVWMIYPMNDHDELSDPVYNSRLIWQVVKLEYK